MLAVRSRGRVAEAGGVRPPSQPLLLCWCRFQFTHNSSLLHSSLFTLHSLLFTLHFFTLYSSLFTLHFFTSSLLHHFARLHDKADMFHQGYVGQRVARHGNQVGGAAWLNRSDFVGCAKHSGGANSRGLDRLHR